MLRVLAVAAAAVLVGCGGPGIADSQGARVTHFTVQSRHVGQDMRSALVVPEGGGRGLLVFLHGRGGGKYREDGSLHEDSSPRSRRSATAPRWSSSPTAATTPTGTTAAAGGGGATCSTR